MLTSFFSTPFFVGLGVGIVIGIVIAFLVLFTGIIKPLIQILGLCGTIARLFSSGDEQSEERRLVPFNTLPIGAWFRFNMSGEAGTAVTQKTHKNGGSNGNQYVSIGDEDVWWVLNYKPAQ
jgi:MFS superfamily sulfate permease-like transporter